MLALLAPLVMGSVGILPAQEAAAPAAVAPVAAPVRAPALAGRRFVLAERTHLSFSVPTNGGVMAGTLPVKHIEARGLEGWGSYEVVVVLDVKRLTTGDPFWEDFIRSTVLHRHRRGLTLRSVEKLPSASVTEGEQAPPEKLVARVERPGARAMEISYRWEGDAESGTLRIDDAVSLEDLGLSPLPHPFLRAEGPVVVKLEAKLVRGR